MNTILLNLLSKLVNADLIAGYVRAGVAALLGIIVAKVPWMAAIITYVACPPTASIQVPCDITTAQGIVGTFVAGAAVGVWQHVAKTISAPTAMQTVAVTQNLAANGLVPANTAAAVKADPTIAMPDVAKGAS